MHLERDDPPNLPMKIRYSTPHGDVVASKGVRLDKSQTNLGRREGLRAEKGILPPPERIHGVWGMTFKGRLPRGLGVGWASASC
jgi:hypothetical protein